MYFLMYIHKNGSREWLKFIHVRTLFLCLQYIHVSYSVHANASLSVTHIIACQVLVPCTHVFCTAENTYQRSIYSPIINGHSTYHNDMCISPLQLGILLTAINTCMSIICSSKHNHFILKDEA